MFSKFVDAGIGVVEDVSRLFGESSWRLSPLAVALGPVIFLAATVAMEVEPVLGPVAAWVIGGAVGVGLELFGIGASRTAVKLWGMAQANEEQRNWLQWLAGLAGVGVIFYVAAAVLVIWNLENTSLALKLVGTLLYVLSPFAYVIHAVMSLAQRLEQEREKARLREEKQAESEAEQEREEEKKAADFERQEREQQREFDNRMRLLEREQTFALQREKLQLAAETEQERIRAETAVSSADGSGAVVNVQERVPEYDELLAVVRERSANGSVSAAEVQEITGRGKTAAYALLSYGQAIGIVKKVGRGKYQVGGQSAVT